MPSAEELKAIGNDFYSNHDFEAAIMVSIYLETTTSRQITNTELFASVSVWKGVFGAHSNNIDP